MSDQLLDLDVQPPAALVTGATSGIGRAVAVRLAREDFEVIVHGRDARAWRRGRTALNRAADPAEIAEVVAFLASSRAGYVTGAVVAVDGGRAAI